MTETEAMVTGWVLGALMREQGEQGFIRFPVIEPVVSKDGEYDSSVLVTLESGSSVRIAVQELT